MTLPDAYDEQAQWHRSIVIYGLSSVPESGYATATAPGGRLLLIFRGPTEHARELADLLARRHQLIQMQAQEKVRLQRASPVQRESLREHVDC